MKLKTWMKATALSVSALFSASTLAEEPLKVGFVYVGPVGDHGWSYEHDQGRKELEQHYGGKVETTYVENVPEGADAERVITQLAKSGHDLIFTTSFGFMTRPSKWLSVSLTLSLNTRLVTNVRKTSRPTPYAPTKAAMFLVLPLVWRPKPTPSVTLPHSLFPK